MSVDEHGSVQLGVVQTFDSDVGLGTIRSSDGLVYQFHCIEIANGTRQIETGVPVTFGVLPKFGRYEACNIRS